MQHKWYWSSDSLNTCTHIHTSYIKASLMCVCVCTYIRTYTFACVHRGCATYKKHSDFVLNFQQALHLQRLTTRFQFTHHISGALFSQLWTGRGPILKTVITNGDSDHVEINCTTDSNNHILSSSSSKLDMCKIASSGRLVEWRIYRLPRLVGMMLMDTLAYTLHNCYSWTHANH